MKIKKITALEILDSRGKPTVMATVHLTNGLRAQAAVPSGASTGVHEAWELRDNDPKRFGGQGVLKAVRNIETKISPALKGQSVLAQEKIDRIMCKLDGTENKKKLGANAILAVSLACARAAALSQEIPLYKYLRELSGLKNAGWKFPLPMMNIINGGKHAEGALTIQEFMIVPKASTWAKRLRMGAEVFQKLKGLLHDAGCSTLVGDEGGFAPAFKFNEEALDFIVQAIKKAGYKPGKDVGCAVDFAASNFFQEKTGHYALDGHKYITADEVIKVLEEWRQKYPIVSLEDPLAEDDWLNWAKLTGFLGGKQIIVGDDLFVTNEERLKFGIENHAANAILIKLNQIGTLTETLQTIRLAKANRYKVIISHRSGETVDTFIADLAVAVNADFIKSGSLARSERSAKYNRLLEIEREVINQ